MKNFFRLLAATLLVLSCSAPAKADLVSYDFAGTFTLASDPLNSFNINTGNTFSGSFTYDTTLPISSSGPGNVVYEKLAPIAPMALSMTVNGIQYSASNSSAPLHIQVTNNSGGLHDQFVYNTIYSGSLDHPQSASYPVSYITVSFRDDTQSVFSGTAIPSSLDLNDFNVASFSIGMSQILGDPGTEALFIGTITSLTSVPEPGSLTAMLLALPLLGMARRRL